MWVGTLRAEQSARQRWNGDSRHRISVHAEDKMEHRKWRGGGRGMGRGEQQEARHRLESSIRDTHGALQGHNRGQAGKEQRCLRRVGTQGD